MWTRQYGSAKCTDMLKRLTRTGNSLALVLDRSILEATGIDADTKLEVSTDGDVIVVSPVRPKQRTDRLRKVLDDLDREHAGSVPFVAWQTETAFGGGPVPDPRRGAGDPRPPDRALRRGARPPRPSGSLKSALAMPAASFAGEHLHPSLPRTGGGLPLPSGEEPPIRRRQQACRLGVRPRLFPPEWHSRSRHRRRARRTGDRRHRRAGARRRTSPCSFASARSPHPEANPIPPRVPSETKQVMRVHDPGRSFSRVGPPNRISVGKR